MKRSVVLFAFLAIVIAIPRLLPAEEPHPDKIIGKHTITGRVAYFDQGDYLHVVVTTEDKSDTTFLLGNEICFIAHHLDLPMKIEFQMVNRYFPEGGDYYPVNLMQLITAGTKDKWDASKDRRPDPKTEQACLQLLQKLPPPPVQN